MTTRGRNSWMRTVVLTVGIALLGLALLPPAVGATQSDVSANATFQKLLCEAGGGHATVETERNVAEGLISATVICRGGTFDGMECINGQGGTNCSGAFPRAIPRDLGGQMWESAQIIAVIETGTVEQFQDLLADVEAANEPEPGAEASVVSGDDQHQDQNTHKSKPKKGKHGKKGGKHRKH